MKSLGLATQMGLSLGLGAAGFESSQHHLKPHQKRPYRPLSNIVHAHINQKPAHASHPCSRLAHPSASVSLRAPRLTSFCISLSNIEPEAASSKSEALEPNVPKVSDIAHLLEKNENRLSLSDLEQSNHTLSFTTDRDLVIRHLGITDYAPTWTLMSQTASNILQQRTNHHKDPLQNKPQDQLWLLQHKPVFTLGAHADIKHLLSSDNIPAYWTDRAGEITYHGPGQLVLYPIFDLRQQVFPPGDLIHLLEQSVQNCLLDFGIESHLKPGAPGVYIDGKKIASVALRITKGVSTHGVSLNVNTNLKPFSQINPCGYAGLASTAMSEYVENLSVEQVGEIWLQHFLDLIANKHKAHSEKTS